MKYVCSVCGWEYDESAGYPEGGIAPGTPWSEVPEDSQDDGTRRHYKHTGLCAGDGAEDFK